ncbi:MAG: ATP-binding protein [Alphaproteobacteria bacterium]|nr:ATP-binding protein [Alphaproteobacteria bacterium]
MRGMAFRVRCVLSGLTVRFLSLALPIFLIVNAVGLFAYLDYRHVALQEELAAEVAAVSVRLGQAVVGLAAAGEQAVATKVVGAMAGNRSIECVELRSSGGGTLLFWPFPDCGSRLARMPDVAVPLSNGQDLLVKYSDVWVSDALKKETFYLGGAFVVSGLVAFLASVVAHLRLIGRPIDALREAIENRAATGTRRPVKPQSTGPLRDILDAYNAMLEKEQELEADAQESRIAEAAARAADKAKSEFLATVSHEMRTPMNVIIGLGEVLSETDLDREQRAYVSNIARSADDSLSLINEIIDYTMMSTGEMALDETDFVLFDLADRVTTRHRPAAVAKGLTLTLQLADDLPERLLGDDKRLGRVLSGLVDNAIKFTDAGHVRVSCSSDIRDNGLLRIDVIDTGIGISENMKSRIFEPFQQVDGTHARRNQGLGLGLAICRDLVISMKGTLTVDSRAGMGSVFSVRVPMTASATVSGVPGEASGPGAPKRVLVVDDSASNRDVVMAMLRREPVEIDCAASGAEALRKLDQGLSYDLILMDIQMPGMSGLETAAKIRNGNLLSADIPILALTANTHPEDRAFYLREGMQAVLPKPVRKSSLLEAIGRYAERIPTSLSTQLV